MAIKFGWVRKRDGEPLTRISVTHVLTRGDLANLLITAIVPFTHDDLADLPKSRIEREIRDQLLENADQMHWWTDNYTEDGQADEPSVDEIREWAARQIEKL